MHNITSLPEYRIELQKNISAVKELLEEGSAAAALYPMLSKRLCSYGHSLGNKLIRILTYAIQYGQDDERQFISRDSFRGFEAALSYETMTGLYGGSAETWKRCIGMLCSLGLLYIHKPDQHDAAYNTPAQEYSRTRAMKRSSHRKPVSWYSFPRYSDSVLQEAEMRSEALKGIGTGSMNKDTLRDIFGSKAANTAYDTGYDISGRTVEYRDIIKAVMLNQIRKNGYTTQDNILCEAYHALMGDDVIDEASEDSSSWRIRKDIERTWKAYRHTLMKETEKRYSAPTATEREAFSLMGKGWIIR